MASGRNKTPYFVRPRTAVLTRGFDPKLSVGSARPAVFRSSTYVFSSPEAAERAFRVALGRSAASEGENIDLIYSRLSHPNAEILEDQITPLEPLAVDAAVFNSGMAAISTLFLQLCPPGSAFVYTTPIYGGTQHLIHQVLEPLGIRAIAAPAGNARAIAEAIETTPNLRLVLIETPANPTLIMTDIADAVLATRRKGAERPLVAVDNTFMGPVFQHPLELGADITVYSATKFLGGHSDILAGVILANEQSIIDGLRGLRAVLGNILQPDECWILDSRLPSVDLRMSRQSKNAERVVAALSDHPKISQLLFPTRFSDPAQLSIYNRQCSGPGSVIAIDLGTKSAAFDFLRRLKITKNAVSLGGIESLACHPGTTTHSELSAEEQQNTGVTPGLVRISVGVEDARDLASEYTSALDAL
jgi:methionine-gamma-lyase